MDKENQQKMEKMVELNKISYWKIDKRMFPYKVHYFLYMGAMGSLLPFLPSIGITRFGFGAANLAVIYTVQQFLFIVIKPAIGYIVDYFNNLKETIVAFIIINSILSSLLLAIPAITDDSITGHKANSQLQNESAHIIFCNLCPISSEFITMAKYLPVAPAEYQDEHFCEKENNIEIFVGYCPKDFNSTTIRGIKLVIEIHTCYSSKSNLKQLKSIDANPLNNNSSVILIKFFHNWISPEIDIICRNIENVFEFESPNFTLNDYDKVCFQYPRDTITSNNTKTMDKLKISNDIICNSSKVNNKAEISKYDSFKTYQFWLFSLILFTTRACTSAMFTLSDTACHEAVHNTGAEFGKQRAWGAIGWSLMGVIAGFLNDYFDGYWAAMILMSSLSALLLWNLTKINLVKPHYSKSIFKDVKTILRSGEFIAIEIGIFFNGMGTGIVFFFLAWFILDIGGSRLLIGLVQFVQCFLGEAPCMVLSGWLIKKIGSFNVVSVALFATAIRFLAYSSLKNPWMILPIECLEGVTFGTFYAAMTSYGKKNAKPGTEATTQSLLSSTYEGLGAGMGCLLGGACFDYFGGYTTFFYGGLFFVGATAINVTSTIMLHFRKGSKETSQGIPSVDFRY